MCIYGHRLFIIATIIVIDCNCSRANKQSTKMSQYYLQNFSQHNFSYILFFSFQLCCILFLTFTVFVCHFHIFLDLFAFCNSHLILFFLPCFHPPLTKVQLPIWSNSLRSSFPQLHGFQLAAHCQHSGTSSHLKLKCLFKLPAWYWSNSGTTHLMIKA